MAIPINCYDSVAFPFVDVAGSVVQKVEKKMKKKINQGGGGGDGVIWLDQYQYLSNCPPTPPLTQQQSIDNKLRLMLG